MTVKPFKTTSIIALYLLGIAIRYYLITSKYQTSISNHIEVSTPLNSWKRVSEGLYLKSLGINPYDGDLLHEAPLSMALYENLRRFLPIEVMFLVFDTTTALLLYFVAKKYMQTLYQQQESEKLMFCKEGEEFLLTALDLKKVPVLVAVAYLLNPYVIFNCVGFSTTVFHNCFLAMFLLAMLSDTVLLSCVSLASATIMSLYPAILIIPLSLHLKSKLKAIMCILLFLTLIYASINDTFNNVYGFILTVPDLQPNIGLFWYFFTEMFDHFRDLFIYSFQINATILYLIPLAIKFRKDPFLLAVALLFLIAVFKSYPNLGDVGFVLSLIPCFSHLFNYSQQGFLVGVIFLITTALGPILWHLWIYSNSANANFYFGVTLAFAIAQIFLVTDILFGYLKRDFYLKYGKARKLDGKEALLKLQ